MDTLESNLQTVELIGRLDVGCLQRILEDGFGRREFSQFPLPIVYQALKIQIRSIRTWGLGRSTHRLRIAQSEVNLIPTSWTPSEVACGCESDNKVDDGNREYKDGKRHEILTSRISVTGVGNLLESDDTFGIRPRPNRTRIQM